MKTFIYVFDVEYGVDEWWWHFIDAENREEADKLMIKNLIDSEDMDEKEAQEYLDEENGGLNDVIEVDHYIKNEKHLECSPTGRITYRKLRDLLNQMSEEQLDMDVTIELPWDHGEDECIAGELTICGPTHEVLDDFHPTIRALANKDDNMNEEFEK